MTVSEQRKKHRSTDSPQLATASMKSLTGPGRSWQTPSLAVEKRLLRSSPQRPRLYWCGLEERTCCALHPLEPQKSNNRTALAGNPHTICYKILVSWVMASILWGKMLVVQFWRKAWVKRSWHAKGSCAFRTPSPEETEFGDVAHSIRGDL